MIYAIGFLVGCWGLLQCTQLPCLWLVLLLAAVCLAIGHWGWGSRWSLPWGGEWPWSRGLLVIACGLFGVFWQGWHCQGLLAKRLSVAEEGKALVVVGTISEIPQCDAQQCTFTFSTQQLAGTERRIKLRLSWYGVEQRLQVAERWQLTVRLKRPRGTLNPGSFDAEAWSWQHHFSAKGYVNHKGDNRYLGIAKGYALAQWRERLLQACQALLVRQPLGGVITALNLGWTQDIPYAQRVVVQRTGTAHLLAISGLHVGMVAGLVVWLLRRLWSLLPRLPEILPAPTVAAVGGIVAALIYSEMAGFACSAQRACVMSALLFLPKVVHRHITVKTALFRALWVVLLWDPCVVASSGFWLSFMAVFVLVFARYHQSLSRWAQHLEAQWICLVGLLPLSCWYFQQISLVSVVANLVAIPVVGFVVLPLVLLGSALALQQPAWAKLVFIGAMKLLAGLGVVLAWLSQQRWAVWSFSFSHGWELLAVVGGCALLVFTQKNWRWVGVLGIIPVALPTLSPLPVGQFKLIVLDVGQGLATVISTRHHSVVYDTGPKFSPQRDAGQQIVLPTLLREKIRRLDVLVVSHGDNDHAGGALAILNGLPVTTFYTSAVEQFSGTTDHLQGVLVAGTSFSPKLVSMRPSPQFCTAGKSWYWDGVKFEFLQPPPTLGLTGNNRSCVLKVSSDQGSVLFPGDIEKPAEQWLSRFRRATLRSDVILVPHHGSKTSSTADFIASVQPRVAILCYGYHNRYHHPHETIVQRYQQAGVRLIDTLSSGAISYTFGSGAPWHSYRQKHQAFWRVPEE